MNIFQRPDGLFVAEEHAATEPVAVTARRAEDAGVDPLPHHRDWYKDLTDEQKNELLGFLPSVFLRCNGSSLGLDGQVRLLMDRAIHMSGAAFEVFT